MVTARSGVFLCMAWAVVRVSAAAVSSARAAVMIPRVVLPFRYSRRVMIPMVSDFRARRCICALTTAVQKVRGAASTKGVVIAAAAASDVAVAVRHGRRVSNSVASRAAAGKIAHSLMVTLRPINAPASTSRRVLRRSSSSRFAAPKIRASVGASILAAAQA